MSLQEVQARTAALQARFAELTGQPRPVAAPVRTFAQELTAVAAPTVADRSTGGAAVALAKEQVGTPYVFGGSEPGAFDCSGLVQWVYGKLGVDLPRHSTEQGKAGVAVAPEDAQPGDLVYFDRPGTVDHIGIYAGGGQWVVAPHTGAKVRVEPVDLQRATSIRRVTGTPTATPFTGALPPAAERYRDQIAQAASATGVDPHLLTAVAWTESGFDAGATSPVGAQGLMQLMPRTAEGLGVDATDPAQALMGGARYLAQQLSAFGGRTDLALAAYNAGPTAVRRAGGVPDYAETQDYVAKVLTRYRSLGGTA